MTVVTSMLTLLLDGDIFVYQIASAMEIATDWGDDLWTLHADAQEGKLALDSYIENVRLSLEADELVVALSDRSANFRKLILPTYKHNRAKVRKPMILMELREYVTTRYKTYIKPCLEADDVLGILATTNVIKGDKIIVSIDKDLKSIPGAHYNMKHPEDGVFEMSTEEADKWHMIQTLTGDATDGYVGCPGIGAKTAEKLLAEAETYTYEHMWPIVVEAYAKKGLSEEEALTMARVARILRKEDYDFKKRQVIPWQPNR